MFTAQSGRFSGGLELGLPVGDYADFNSLGIGVSARYEYSVEDKISIMATAGFQSFSAKEFGGLKPDATTIIPVQIGGKYYFNEAWNGFYAGAELGLHMISGNDN